MKRFIATAMSVLLTLGGGGGDLVEAANPQLIFNEPTVVDKGEGRVTVEIDWQVLNGGNRTWLFSGNVDNISTSINEELPLPMKKHIRVLNVYPQVNNIEQWLDEWGNKVPGYSIDCTGVDWITYMDNPASYLHKKNADGTYYYDVVFFGTWDTNRVGSVAWYNFSDSGANTLKTYVTNGGSAVVGHDVVRGTGHHVGNDIDSPNNSMLLELFNLDSYDGSFGETYSTKVQIDKVGALTQYPYSLGPLGTVLTIPLTHTLNQKPRGTGWMSLYDSKATSYQDITYLSMHKNTALIQTGHSNGSASDDEQKVLTNLCFALAQGMASKTGGSVITATAEDRAAPKAVTDLTTVYNEDGTIGLSWSKVEDVGTDWVFKVTGQSTSDSATIEATQTVNVTSGVRGYSIVFDNALKTVPDSTIETTGNVYNLTNSINESGYIHIVAIDHFGNVSEPMHVRYSPAQFKVRLDTLGGTSAFSEMTMKYGSQYGRLPVATRDGSEFVGWFTEKAGGSQVTSSDLYMHVKDTVLYAQYGLVSKNNVYVDSDYSNAKGSDENTLTNQTNIENE